MSFILFFIENTLRIGLAYYGRNGITDRRYYPQRDPDILSTLTDHQHLTGTWLRFSHFFFSNWGLHDHCYWTFKLYLRASPKIVAFTSLLPWRFPIIESHPSSSLLPPLMHQFQSPSWRCRVRVYLRDRCYKLALAPSLNWYISSSELPRPLRRTILIAILQSISSHIGTRELHRPPPTSFYLIPMITAILVTFMTSDSEVILFLILVLMTKAKDHFHWSYFPFDDPYSFPATNNVQVNLVFGP